MNANLVLVLFYIVTMSLVAPILWATFIPAMIRLIESKRWAHSLFAIELTTVTVSATISWYFRIVVPFVNNSNDPLNLRWFEWVNTILVWPTAIFAVMFLYMEYQKVKLARLQARLVELNKLEETAE